MSLDIDIANAIWRTDNGYRIINSFLIGSSSRKDYIYHQKENKTIKYEDNSYNTIDVINIIKENMKKSNTKRPKIYYRGEKTTDSKKSFVKKSFISVSSNEEQAQQFVDDSCCLFKITVDPDVKRYKTGIEHEILLENDLYWEYMGKQGDYELVKISKPQYQQEMHISTIPITNIEKTEHKLTKEKLKELLKEYKEECELLDIDPTAQGFIDYIESVTTNKIKISIEKANEMIGHRGGKKTRKHKKQSKKQTQKQKTKTKKLRPPFY